MKIIDARSGVAMTPGQRVDYGPGEWIRLDQIVSKGLLAFLFGPKATISYSYIDHQTGRVRCCRQTARLPVRTNHPGFPGQTVAFIPT